MYEPQQWIDGSAGATPLSAARLNYIEAGLEGVAEQVDALGTSVIDHGAAGDGTTDDTAAFAAAIAAGSTVYVPDGTYVISTLSVSGNTTILLADGATLKHKSASTDHMFKVTGTRFRLAGGAVDGNRAGQTARRYIVRVAVPDGTDVDVERVRFTRTQAAAVYADEFGGELDVNYCRFTDMAEHDGVAGHWTTAVYVETGQAGQAGTLRFNHNVLIGTTSPAQAGGAPGGVFFAPTLDYPTGVGNESTFEAIGNWFWGIGQHCSVNDIAPLHTYPKSLGARFIGNYFEQCGFSAIAAKSVEDFVCIGNVIVNGQTSTKNTASEGAISYAAGYQAGASHRYRAVISGNIIDDPGGESATLRQVGIAVLGDADSLVVDAVVSDNVISGTGQSGIRLDYTNGVTLAGNIIQAGTVGSAGSEYGIRVDHTQGDVLVRGNRIHSPNGHGLYCISSSSTARFVVDGNVFEHSGSASYAAILRGVALAKFTGNLINASAGTALSITTDGSNPVAHFAWDRSNTIEAGAVAISYANVTKATGELIGSGSPASVVTAPIGTTYTNLSGGAGTTLFRKESGSGNTGWVSTTSLVVRKSRLTAGDITAPSTAGAWELLAGTTISIPAAVGDYVELSVTMMTSGTIGMFLDWTVAVSAAIARAMSSDTSTPAGEGVPGLYPQPNSFRAALGDWGFVVEAGHRDGGNVVFQLAAKAGGSGTIYRSTTYPMILVARNHGVVSFA